MTSAHLTRWIKATDTRRATPRPASMRACLHSAVATMQSSIKAFTVPIDRDAALSSCVGDQRALESSVDVAPNGGLARIMVAAIAVVAGVVAFDFVVLWLTSGRLIARLPF
jgi:hypothetical protein